MGKKDIKSDLHIHTSASDGTWEPEELIVEIKRNGIGLFAVTDHDSTENIEEISALAKENGLEFIPGVEINTFHKGFNYHILGLGIDHGDSRLQEILKSNREQMEARNDKCILFLESRHRIVSFDEYKEYKNNPRRGGWKALNYLIDKGLCTCHRDFNHLFEGGNPLKNIEFVSPSRAIEAIEGAGGVSVLAHPGVPFYNRDLEHVLGDMIGEGIGGIECFHPDNGREVTGRCLELCKARDLIITGGSDCHGDYVKTRRLGKPQVYLSMLNLKGLFYCCSVI